MKADAAALVEAIDQALPQTQCTRCGYPACRPYAEAIAGGEAAINRCPPGGTQGIVRLAALLGQEPRPLDPACGRETAPQVALIDETACIGCAKCLDACPVDAIIGARKRMHTVLTDWCTGCERCLPPCPVDCIRMLPATRELPPPDLSRARYQAHVARQAHAQAVRAHRLYALEAETIENVVTEDMTRPGIGTPVSAPA